MLSRFLIETRGPLDLAAMARSLVASHSVCFAEICFSIDSRKACNWKSMLLWKDERDWYGDEEVIYKSHSDEKEDDVCTLLL